MLSKLIQRYVSSRLARAELSPASAKAYAHRLDLLNRAVGHLDVGQVRRHHIERWLEQAGNSAAYKRGLLVAAKQFFAWCVAEGLITKSPCAEVRPPRLPRYAPRSLTRDEVAAVLAACPDARARLTILLMVQEGMRRGEVVRLEVGDFDPHGRSFAIRGKGGRGAVTRYVPVSDETVQAIDAYLAEHPARSGPLLRSYPTGRALTPAWASRTVSEAMQAAGVKRYAYDGRSAHALRHTAALHVLEQSHDLRAVQQMLGHTSLGTTGWYLRGDVRGIRKAMAGRRYYTPTAGLHRSP